MRSRPLFHTSLVAIVFLGAWIVTSHGHQDPCHRLHSCPSDSNTYVCGDKGRCDQCPDNEFCLAGKPRLASSPTPTPVPPAPSPTVPTTPSSVTVCFTPGGNCTDAIVQALASAKRTILVQAYSFTSVPIAKALLDAHKRGVQVQVILDKSQRLEKYSSADFLANQGVPTMIDANQAILQNKVSVIDGETVISDGGKDSCQKSTIPSQAIENAMEADSISSLPEGWRTYSIL